MRRVLIIIAVVAALFLTGGMCDSAEESTEEEPAEEAAERLQQPRDMYEGNINENLDELRDDLEQTGVEREQRQDDAVPEPAGR